MVESEFTPRQKVLLTKSHLSALIERMRKDQDERFNVEEELMLWWMNYCKVLDKLDKGFSTRDVAEIFLELVTSETLVSKDGQLFSIEVPRFNGGQLVISKKESPTFDEVEELFVATENRFEKKLKVLALVKIVVDYKFPFAYWYFELLEKTALTRK